MPESEGPLRRRYAKAQKDIFRDELHLNRVPVEEGLGDHAEGVSVQHMCGADEEDVVHIPGTKGESRGISPGMRWKGSEEAVFSKEGNSTAQGWG